MKILKFSGIVAGIHLLALILIFANPGCSSSSKPAPSPSDTASHSETPTISVVGSSSSSSSSTISAAPAAVEPISINAAVRYSPTRPNTPAATSLQAEPVANVTPASTYTVAKNDNLTVIAKRHHITIAELASANNLSPSARLNLGQKLIIPSKVSPAAKMEAAGAVPANNMMAATSGHDAIAAKPAADSVTHLVQSGESLGVIARKYGVKPGDIAVANNITDPQKIRAGVELIIPGWQAPGGKNSKSTPGRTGDTATKAGAVSTQPPVETPPPAPRPAAEVPVIKIEDTPANP